jgi:ribosome modulation factor
MAEKERDESDYPAAYQEGWDAALEGRGGESVPYPKERHGERMAWLEGNGDALSLLID